MGRTLAEYKQEIAERRERVLEAFLAQYPGHDTSGIVQAMDYAELLHRGQLRRNGVPYIFHPLDVALLVANAQLDEASVVCALLHDTIEDTVASKQAIDKKFSPHIAEIVQALTKIRSYSAERSREDDKQQTYKRILKAASRDIRPLLIKIFDRLSNMRDMEHMPEGHRRRVSRETMDVYVPLTRRLGMRLIERELSNLSLRYLYPKDVVKLQKKISQEREEREAQLNQSVEVVRKLCDEHNIPVDMRIHWPEISDLYEEEFGLNPNRDVEVRIEMIIEDIVQIYTGLGILHSLYTPVPMAMRDMLASPMANGYRALETRMVIHGRIHHFALMSSEMHDVNNQGIVHNWRVNQSRLSGYFTSYMDLLGELLADEEVRVDDVLTHSQVDGIPVFSPKKDLYIMPAGSTVLDFAYQVHKQIGEQARYGMINGIERPIQHRLHAGDVVQIVTDPKVHPEESWMDIAVTTKAKNSIKSWLRRQVNARAIELGRELLFIELEKYGRDPDTVVQSADFQRILDDEKLSLDELFRLIGFRKLLAANFIHEHAIVPKERVARQKKAERASIRERLFSSLKSKPGAKYRFSRHDIFIKYARCCNPIFGDKVVGVVSEGKGITVHRHNCANLKRIDADKVVEVEWDVEEGLESAVLNLHVTDQQGVLAQVLNTVRKFGLNMSEFNAYTIGHEAFMKIRLDVSSQRELLKVVNEIRKFEAVQTITREE